MSEVNVFVDEVLITEIEQTAVDPHTNATTVHTALNFPYAQGEGFIIVGQIIRSRERGVAQPLKGIIKRILIEYHVKDTPAAAEDTVHPQRDHSGEPHDGEQAVGGKPRSDSASRKRSKKF